MARVLVIDDNEDFRKLALLWFDINRISAEGVANGRAALEAQRRDPAEVIVTDIYMPDLGGVETIKLLRAEFPQVKIIAVTGRPSIDADDALRDAADAGAARTFRKPLKLDALVDAVRALMREHS
jgi:DNA-binding NtrC family response regulator